MFNKSKGRVKYRSRLRFGDEGGQPMDAIFLISVAPIDELDEISLKSGRYQREGGGSKNKIF